MSMKLHFESNLEYQLAAIEAVCDIFRGQEACRTEFTVTLPHEAEQTRLSGTETALGIGNRLRLLDDEVLSNLQAVQLRSPGSVIVSIRRGLQLHGGNGNRHGQNLCVSAHGF